MKDKISVIIPIYNVEHYVERCLQSVLNNTYHEIEVICINDGSTDKSLDILNDIAVKDPRVRLITTENKGVSAARNLGISMAIGTYISFVDADDWIHAKCFETLIKIAKATQADVVISNRKVVLDGQNIEMNCEENFSWKELSLSETYNCHITKQYVTGRVYKTEILRDLTFDSGIKFGEDAAFNLKFFLSKDNIKIEYTDTELYYYFMRNSSVTHTLSPQILWPTLEWYDVKIQNTKLGSKGIFLKEALKSMMLFRYLGMYQKYKKKEIKKMIFFCMNRFWKVEDVSYKTKMQFALLAYFPQVYRLFRIYDDRSLLEWEKEEKNKGKN